MNEGEVNAAAEQLAAAVQANAQSAGTKIESDLQAKAQGLSTGNFAPGGYTYSRIINPVVEPIRAALVTSAKQALFRQAAKNAINESQVRYDSSKGSMQDRQQAAQKAAYEERKRKEAEYEAQQKAYQAAMLKASSGGVAGGGVGGGSVTGGTKLQASQTYRQALQAAANAGNGNAKVAIKYAGNDGRYDGPVANQAEMNALRAIGVQGKYYIKAAAPAPAAKKTVLSNPAMSGDKYLR